MTRGPLQGEGLALERIAARLEAAIEASEPDCRWTPDPAPDGGIEICDEHSEIVLGPEGCEDSPRWWKAKAINVIRAALQAEPSPETVERVDVRCRGCEMVGAATRIAWFDPECPVHGEAATS